MHVNSRTGIDTPGSSGEPETFALANRAAYAWIMLGHSGSNTPPWSSSEDPIPIMLELEPLALGMIPPSVTPTVAFLLIIAGCTVFLSSRLYRLLDNLVVQHRLSTEHRTKTS